MFDVGFSELLVIALVALIVLGPKRLPEVARTAGQWVGRFRRFVADVKQDLDRELQHADLQELSKLKQELADTRRVMEETSSGLMQQANIYPSSNGVVPVPTTSVTPPVMPTPVPAAVSALPPLAEPPRAARESTKASRARRAAKKSAKKPRASKDKHGRSG
jgi:sec-independent protein translocase protein TatB